MSKFKKTISGIQLIAVALIISVPFFIVKQALASTNLSYASMRLNRMEASFVASASDPILVVAKINNASAGTEAKVKITFGSGFTVGASPTTVTTSLGTYEGHTLDAWPSVQATCSGSSQTMTCTMGDISDDTKYYAFKITGGVTNPSTPAQYVNTIDTTTSGDVVIDTANVAINVVSSGSDQVSVTATVPPTFNFALSGNSLAHGTLSTSAVDTAQITADIDTNASNGWVAWIKSTNALLHSSSANDDIETGTVDGTPDSISAGTDKYLVNVATTNGTGTGTPAAIGEYAGNGTTTGGALSTSYQEVANSDGPGDNDGLTITSMVAIGALTKAATDYADTLTIIGAGAF